MILFNYYLHDIFARIGSDQLGLCFSGIAAIEYRKSNRMFIGINQWNPLN